MKRSYKLSSSIADQDKEKAQKELDLGYLNLSDECFEQARLCFLLVLEYDGACADAHWGLMLADREMSSEDELYTNAMSFKDIVQSEHCQKALELASANLRKKYDSLLERIVKINEGDSY